ncbi:MAG: hypothetical protein Q9187_002168 [Circinaria calcarea]
MLSRKANHILIESQVHIGEFEERLASSAFGIPAASSNATGLQAASISAWETAVKKRRNATSSSTPFPFLNLPLELQILIYEYTVGTALPIRVGEKQQVDGQPSGRRGRPRYRSKLDLTDSSNARALPQACRLAYHNIINSYYGLNKFEFCNRKSFVNFTDTIGTLKCNLITSVAFESPSFVHWQTLTGMQRLRNVKVCFSVKATYGTLSIHHKRLLQLCRASKSLKRVELELGLKLSLDGPFFFRDEMAEKQDDFNRCVVELAAILQEKHNGGSTGLVSATSRIVFVIP